MGTVTSLPNLCSRHLPISFLLFVSRGLLPIAQAMLVLQGRLEGTSHSDGLKASHVRRWTEYTARVASHVDNAFDKQRIRLSQPLDGTRKKPHQGVRLMRCFFTSQRETPIPRLAACLPHEKNIYFDKSKGPRWSIAAQASILCRWPAPT